MLQLRSRESLSSNKLSWLNARYHFRVRPDGPPEHGPLGALVVWNDDEIAPHSGFGFHRHQDMEIISYIREGAVTHRDTTGSDGRTAAGDVQVMSAGSGILHSEHNREDTPLRLFQIWIQPKQPGGAPRWANRKFPKEDRAGQLVILASGDPADTEALPIGADARVMGATLLAGTTISYDLPEGRCAYLAPATGVVTVNGQQLRTGDGVAASREPRLEITAEETSEFILVDVGPAPGF